MAYTGLARPFNLPVQNNLEIVNETLILLNSYFMLLYSDFVVDLNTRYITGWSNVGVIIALVCSNLVLMTYIQGRAAYFKIKLALFKRKQAKLKKQKAAQLVQQVSLKTKRQFKNNLSGKLVLIQDQQPTVDNFLNESTLDKSSPFRRENQLSDNTRVSGITWR